MVELVGMLALNLPVVLTLTQREARRPWLQVAVGAACAEMVKLGATRGAMRWVTAPSLVPAHPQRRLPKVHPWAVAE